MNDTHTPPLIALTRNMKMVPPSVGQLDLVRKSGLFDAEWYCKRYPDVALSQVDPLVHFVQIGVLLLRDPSPRFSTAFYLSDNPDLAEAGVNPILHYIQHGRQEGRAPRPSNLHKQIYQAGLARMLGPGQLFTAPLPSCLCDLLPAPGDMTEILPDGLVEAAQSVLAGSAARPEISVVMPTWNRAHVITDAVDSVMAQNFRPCELLIVDDGSEDGTIALLAARYPEEIASGRIRLLEGRHDGVSAARNIGLRHAKGDLIAYLDSDNTWRPEYLCIMAAAFTACPELMVAYSGLAHNDKDRNTRRITGQPYDRKTMLKQNFIDLNVFMHRRLVYDQLGGFDESLRRLVDWDLISRYTKLYDPVFLPFVGVDYFLDEAGLGNITRTVPLEDAKQAVNLKNARERVRYGLDEIRLAYVVWDWPAMSQTFIVSELRWLVDAGIDVKVYFHTGVDKEAKLDFDIRAEQVEDADHLAAALARDRRTLCHNHFVYPGTTLLVWPACRKLGIPFTLFAHAVDIFHESNIGRNRISEISVDPLCLKIFVYSDHHRNFLARHGVPATKVAYNFQAVNLSTFKNIHARRGPSAERPVRGIVVARFVEKKGLPTLIEAMAQLAADRVEILLYGYGPLEDTCRAMVAERGLHNVHFCGPLETPEAYAAAIMACDFVVVPSIIAQNGDTEGFPTVILEAMAAGRPVITTTVSSLPDFLVDGENAILTEPGDPASLAAGIKRLLEMDENQVEYLVSAAKDFISDHVGVVKTMQAYWDIWTETTLSLFMVTYNTPDYDDAESTFEIIRRVLTHTTAPYTLTIVDNGSEPDFLDHLTRLAAAHSHIRLIRLEENRFCGPASNLALRCGDATHAIYICSKEGFVARHGWERGLLEYMRSRPGTGLAGYKTHMPRFTLGAELATHPQFGYFRNPSFARAHPARPFQHIQGGVFILDRAVFAQIGGFSDRLVQNLMDVEYSYFLESEGVTLGQIDNVASLTTKTLPQLPAIIDEKTVIAHPLTLETAHNTLDPLQYRDTTLCNLCGSLHSLDTAGICRSCGSTGFGRKVFRHIAHDWRCHRSERAWLDCDSDPALTKALANRMFDLRKNLDDGPFRLILTDRTHGPGGAAKLLSHLDESGLAFMVEDVPVPPVSVERLVFKRYGRVLRSDERRPIFLFRKREAEAV